MGRLDFSSLPLYYSAFSLVACAILYLLTAIIGIITIGIQAYPRYLYPLLTIASKPNSDTITVSIHRINTRVKSLFLSSFIGIYLAYLATTEKENATVVDRTANTTSNT